ncbi:hypothetical protein HMPREF1982_02676 [Clostridiales bacterium oral taxon 876 str. F0540]|nr:hypothetical protein HMPREF1982_02676 [Clostridiales bacterium oral taxon 876 str. F0540]
MYCVIQKVVNKKYDPYGEHKEIEVHSTTWSMNGVSKTHYSYIYGGGRFERPIKDAYKISIHKSYRENGKLKKKQWVICTMGYYSLLHSWPGDCIVRSVLDKKLKDMGITEEELWNMVYIKLQPIINSVKVEFERTEEYKTKQKHKQILDKYLKDKEEFEKRYGKDTYDYCYDVFGTLRNEKYLKEIESNYQAQQTYRNSYSGYQSNKQSNYSDYDFNSYYKTNVSTYTEEEREYLKAIYKAAAMKLHPDIKKDNGEGMKLLNKLKNDWGI